MDCLGTKLPHGTVGLVKTGLLGSRLIRKPERIAAYKNGGMWAAQEGVRYGTVRKADREKMGSPAVKFLKKFGRPSAAEKLHPRLSCLTNVLEPTP